jgi:hypothetical protein
MITKKNKVVMACRIEPDLKETLEQEAYNNGLSLSAYIEEVMSKHEVIFQVESLEEENEKLQASLRQEVQVHKRVLTENERLRNENAALEYDVRKNQQRLFWLDDVDIANVTKLVSTLNPQFPTLTNKEILLVCLATAIRNEGSSWELYKMKDFLKYNPDFLTPKLRTR